MSVVVTHSQRTLMAVLGSVLLGLTSSAWAATLYVDNAASCPGTGSTGTPYCTIQGAFNVVNAGDTIRIRTGTGIYDQSAQVTNRSGTAAQPITLEPESGASFIIRDSGNGALRAAIWIQDSDYWTIQGLTFDDNGINPSVWGGLRLQAASRAITGTKILNNTFLNGGGSQSFADTNYVSGHLSLAGCAPALGCGGAGFRVQNTLIQGNTFTGARLKAIGTIFTDGTTITQNTISGQRCGRETDSAANEVGIHLTYNNVNMTISNNTLRDFDAASVCTLPNQGYATTAGIWCDVGGGDSSQNVTITGNTIYNIDNGKNNFSNPLGIDQTSTALFIEQGCAGFHVHHNVVYNIGTYALRNQYHSLSLGQAPNLYEYNTFYNIAMHPTYFTEGVAIFRNNVTSKGGVTQINIPNSSLSSLTINYNLYDDNGSQTAIGARNGTIYTLTNWQAQCSCDSASQAADPAFVNEASADFHLQASSPARGLGTGGSDAGAFAYAPQTATPSPCLRVIPALTMGGAAR